LFNKDGMDAAQFGELLVTSGLVLMPNVKWITFHSGYDFGYLLKVLMANPLPADEGTFFELLRLFFPSFYDIKYLMKTCKSLKGGLQDIADDLGIERIGIQHQAGSDSLLTAKAFFKIRHVFFDDHMDDTRYSGFLFGLGIEPAYSSLGKPAGSGTLTPSTSTSDVNLGNTPPASTVSY
jgi:CCR4-NOT transcription complex subunit 7/8